MGSVSLERHCGVLLVKSEHHLGQLNREGSEHVIIGVLGVRKKVIGKVTKLRKKMKWLSVPPSVVSL